MQHVRHACLRWCYSIHVAFLVDSFRTQLEEVETAPHVMVILDIPYAINNSRDHARGVSAEQVGCAKSLGVQEFP